MRLYLSPALYRDRTTARLYVRALPPRLTKVYHGSGQWLWREVVLVVGPVWRTNRIREFTDHEVNFERVSA